MIETIQLKLKSDSSEAVRSVSFKDYLYYRHVEQADILLQFLEEMWDELFGANNLPDKVMLFVKLNDLESQERILIKEHGLLDKEAAMEFLLGRVDAMWDEITEKIGQ